MLFQIIGHQGQLFLIQPEFRKRFLQLFPGNIAAVPIAAAVTAALPSGQFLHFFQRFHK
jgi:hypothetical protein